MRRFLVLPSLLARSSSSHEESADSSDESESDVVALEAVEVEGRFRAEDAKGLSWGTVVVRDTFVKPVTACNFDFVDFEIVDLLIFPIQDGQVFVFVASETVLAERLVAPSSTVRSSLGVESTEDEASLLPLMLPPVKGTELASE